MVTGGSVPAIARASSMFEQKQAGEINTITTASRSYIFSVSTGSFMLFCPLLVPLLF